MQIDAQGMRTFASVDPEDHVGESPDQAEPHRSNGVPLDGAHGEAA